MITKCPWFGPRGRFGWGWRPITWQAWFVTALFVAVAVWGCAVFGSSPMSLYVALADIAALVAVCLLTGTRPGGFKRRT